MRDLSAALIGAIFVLCTTSALLVRGWVLWHSFDMAARSPVLVMVVGVAPLTTLVLVLLHWILLLEGRRFRIAVLCYVRGIIFL